MTDSAQDKAKKTVAHDKPTLLQTLPEDVFPTDVNALEDTVDTHTQDGLMITTGGEKGEQRVQLPLFDNKDIYSKIPDLSVTGRTGGRRYAIGELLGEGGYGCVFDLRDNNFERNVAVKMLGDDHASNVKIVRKFTHEALISAQLDHPNILPVYDMDVSEDGSLFYTMKKVEGYSLIEAIENDIPEGADNQIKSIDDIIRVFIKVAEALSYAHSKGIIHQDIKPSNIMLGDFGEVSLVDWGSAIDAKVEEAERGRLVGTPMYMSPEQSRREGADERSDIYCLGASLFHALTGHFPVWHESQRIFWQYKKEGIIDPLTPEDEKNVPKPLIAICFKCLDPEAEERYQTVEELADDLKNYQAGLSVGVYHYSFVEFLKQWARRHEEAMYGAMIVTAILVIVGIFSYIEYRKELSGWGKPVLTETFENDQDWRNNWRIYRGTFAVEDGRLVTKDGPAFFAFYDKRIYGSVAIEFEGEMLPDSPPCDLSVAYISDFMPTEVGGYALEDMYLLQNGGYHNTCSMILGPEGRLDYENVQLENGRKYRVRAEIDGNRMSLFLDGNLLCTHLSEFPRTSGYIGIYGYFHSKAFDNIKIYTKKVAEKVTIMETADVFYTKELYLDAIQQYKKISESHSGTDLADEAIYKMGLCKYKLELYDEAQTVWSSLSSGRFASRIQSHKWDILAMNKDYLSIIKGMEAAYGQAGDSDRTRMQTQWVTLVNKQRSRNWLECLPRYLELWENNFADDPVSSFEASQTLLTVGDYESVPKYLKKFPTCMVDYYRARGEFDVVINDYPNMRHQRMGAMVGQLDFDRALREYADMKMACADILVHQGKYSEVRSEYSEYEPVLARILLIEKKYDEVIKLYPKVGWGELLAYMLTYRFDEFDKYPEDKVAAREIYQVQICRAIHAFRDGKKELAFSLIKGVQGEQPNYSTGWAPQLFSQFFLKPALQTIAGDTDAFAQAVGREKSKTYLISQRLAYTAKYLAGEIDDEIFQRQPHRLFIESRLIFYKALRADMQGQRKMAAELYQAYLNLERRLIDLEITKLAFAEWRLKEIL